MSEYLVQVGYCKDHPIMPDWRMTFIEVEAETDTDAMLAACQMVAARGMIPTSSRIESMVL